MKRIFLLAVIISVAFTLSEAKVNKQNPYSLVGEKNIMPGLHSIGLNPVRTIMPNLVRVGQAQWLKPIKKGSKNLLPSSTINKPDQFQINAAITSVPEKLIGKFQFKGVSYFSGGYITGETVIRADSTNPNKIWIRNIIPGVSNKEVYGMISADQKKISIPQGQYVFVDGLDKAALTIYESSSNISGQFDALKGVITITSNYWGAKAIDGWLEVYYGEVTYTRADMIPPSATYRQPQGGLFLGLDPDSWGSYSSTCLINSPYVTWNWKNPNIEEGVSYLWSYTNKITGGNYTSTKDSLLMEVQDSYYSNPTLTATNGKGYSSSFILGADFDNKDSSSFAIAGGNAALLGFDVQCDYGAANLDNGFILLKNVDYSYFFGTGASKFTDKDYQSLLVYYEEPLSTLYFEGVNVYLYVFDAPDNTPFTMNVVLANYDEEEDFSSKGSIVASSTINAKDVVPVFYEGELIGYTMKFSEFKSIDSEGFEIIKEFIEMDQPFYLELTGFNVPGVSMAVCTEAINPSDEGSRSGFMFSDNDTIYYLNDFRQTMYFNLAGAVYSYISLSEDTIYDNKSGGTYNIDASPFFDTLYFDKQSLPDWLNVEIVGAEYSEKKWGATVRVIVDALGANKEPRYFNLELKTTGARKTLFINQGGPVSNNEIRNELSVFAYKNEQGFLIKYPEMIESLTVYSATGAFIGQYNLPENGSYQLNSHSFAKGLYILKLQGSGGNRVIKIVK